MSLTADSNGQVTGRFTIPANVPVGAKLVEFGTASGSTARATFVGRGQITVQEMRQVRVEHLIITHHLEAYDPLAETFTLSAPAFISYVDVWVCAKGASGVTMVQIRETANGVPTSAILAQRAITTSALVVGQWNRFSFTPTRLEQGVEFAVVVACDDATTAVGIAELGKFDSAQQRWVTSQPYQVGVLLSSSNASTWTPHQEKDLTFRLGATPISATTRTIALPSMAVTAVDEMIVLAIVERPTEDTDVTFTITLPDGVTSVTVAEGERILLPASITGTVTWRANLTGTLTATPVLHKDVQLVAARRLTTGTYVTRTMTAGTGSKVRVYYEGAKPGTSDIAVEVSLNGTGSWTAIPQVAATAMDGTWVDYTRELTGYNQATAAVRITLTGDARNRPQVRKFRVVIT
jgi:hypothetical protein